GTRVRLLASQPPHLCVLLLVRRHPPCVRLTTARRDPRSTLLPYTTLFRSTHRIVIHVLQRDRDRRRRRPVSHHGRRTGAHGGVRGVHRRRRKGHCGRLGDGDRKSGV